MSTIFQRAILTGQGDHGRAGPEDVHAGGVSVAERRVQADVGQLSAPHVLLLGGHVREEDAAGRQSHGLGRGQHVRLAHRREAQQPQDRVRHPLQDLRFSLPAQVAN